MNINEKSAYKLNDICVKLSVYATLSTSMTVAAAGMLAVVFLTIVRSALSYTMKSSPRNRGQSSDSRASTTKSDNSDL